MEQNAYDLTAKPAYKMNLFQWLKWKRDSRKFTKERAKWGWSRYDVWDFDTYLATVISGALIHLAKCHMSHPADISEEEWSERLLYIASCFRQYCDDPECESYHKWEEAVALGTDSETLQKLSKAWHQEETDNYHNKMKRLKEGFDLLYEVYPDLWD